MRRNFLRETSGATALLFATIAPVLFLFAAMAVDCSTFYLTKRQLQSATDAAAIVAAQNLGNPWGAAQANLAANGFSSSAVTGIQLGTYTPDPTLPVGQRFTPGSTGNAVQVTTQVQSAYYFATIMNLF